MEAGFEASLYPADTEYTEITATTIRQWFNFTLPAKGPNMVRSGGTGIGKQAKTVRANRSQSTRKGQTSLTRKGQNQFNAKRAKTI